MLDFLDILFGDGFPVDDFKPRHLKHVRTEMIKPGRFCRRVINRYTFRIISMFAWGVENEMVQETTWRTLKVVKALRKGEEGTYDNPPREEVSDDVVKRRYRLCPRHYGQWSSFNG